MAKYEAVLTLLEDRIRHGDYLIKEFPSERKLAEETGVSYMTARKVTQLLVKKGLLKRKDNGRLYASAGNSVSEKQIVYLSPAFPGMLYYKWLADIMATCDSYGVHVRPFEYVHYHDVVFQQVLDTADGVFFILKSEEISDHLLGLIEESEAMVVSLERDLTAHGIPSILTRTPMVIDLILTHLKDLGHKRILGLNTQPGDFIITERLNRMHAVARNLGLELELVNDPVQVYGDTLEQSVRVLNGIMDGHALNVTAIVGVTQPAAIGAQRVMFEKGIRVPDDISVCSIANEGMCPYTTPAITTACDIDPRLDISRSIRHMLQGVWEGNLLMAPSAVRLFAGESCAVPGSRSQS